MYLFSNHGLPMFDTGRKFNSRNALFNLTSYRKVKRILKSLWLETEASASSRGDNLVYFPHRLLKQQTKDYASACKKGYAMCNLEESLLTRIQEIEAEVLALNAAFKWLQKENVGSNLKDAKAIFIALEVIFSEFKENKNTDCDCRVSLFIEQLVRLLFELSDVLNTKL